MAVPPPARIEPDQVFPARVDTAIIGGGIAGICAALELAERGQRVVVFEKGIVAGEQSGRNWGWCRQMGRDPAEVPLVKVSLDLWRSIDRRLNINTGFVECGITYGCETEAEVEKREAWYREQALRHGLSTKMISPSETKALVPKSTVDWKGGLYTDNDGRAEPQLAVPEMAKAAQRRGVMVFENCAVRGVERSGGAISGVFTERGAVNCKAAILAGGAWSRRFCHNMGIHLPQLIVRNSVFRSEPVDYDLGSSFAGGGVALRRRHDGGFTIADDTYNTADIVPDSFRLLPDFLPTLKDNWRDFRFSLGPRFVDEARLKSRWKMDEVSPFEQVRRLDPEPHEANLRSGLRALHRVHPEFANVNMLDTWAGAIDVTPDIVPVISAIDSVPGFFMATGFSGHGFGLGPGAGKLMAEIVAGEQTCVDASPFRFDRF